MIREAVEGKHIIGMIFMLLEALDANSAGMRATTAQADEFQG